MTDRLQRLMEAARRRYLAGAGSNGIVALLLVALLWFTQWPSLRAGLLILLAGYLGAAAFMLNRSRTLARETDEPAPKWFGDEERFISRLNLFGGVTRTLGFIVLGYGFWTATGSIALALALGVVYPVAAYFGMERRKYLRARRLLQSERDAVVQ